MKKHQICVFYPLWNVIVQKANTISFELQSIFSISYYPLYDIGIKLIKPSNNCGDSPRTNDVGESIFYVQYIPVKCIISHGLALYGLTVPYTIFSMVMIPIVFHFDHPPPFSLKLNAINGVAALK